MVTQETFGSLVRRYRREAELTQEALAERAGVSVRLVRGIEAGSQHRPRPDTLQLLLDALAVPADERDDFLRTASLLSPSLDSARERIGGDRVAGTAQLLAILIADMRGHTAYSLEHGAESGIRLAERFAVVAAPVVEQHEGRVVELRGDEALCVFPSARQALRAALALQETYRGDGTETGLPLGVGIGLDAGEVIPVGNGYRGSALNLAARLSALAGPGEVLASEAIAHLARTIDGVRYRERGAVNLQGVAEPVRVIEVVAEPSVPPNEGDAPREQPLPIGAFLGALPSNPLAGREDEVERIEAALDRVQDGTGQLLVLGGAPGFGKTRLAQEAAVKARNRGFLLATGRGYAAEQDSSYTPFMEALAMAFSGATAAVRREAAVRWPHLGGLLPEDVAAAPTPARDAAEDRQRLHWAVARFLAACAEERPVALLIDDVHWADEKSLALLAHLARSTRGARVLLLVTYRDTDVDRQHPLDTILRELNREGLVERIPVHRLSPDGTAAMVEATIGETEASEEFAAFVHRRTKGTPFFIEEMLRSLGGRYRLLREIGAGGMGRVFEAVDTRTGGHVAAKLMFASAEADLDALLRFQQEGAVLATLKHPNIVEVYTTFIEEHASCIVMELLEGRSAGDLLRDGELSLPRIKTIARQAAAALACAHAKAIVHRDIKPDNLMVLDGDQVKVTDFGIARILRPDATVSTMQSTGMSLGTPLYMAPEQIEGRKVDGRADIYSLGAVLYHLVTRRPPFEGTDPVTIAYKHVHEAPTPPSEVNADVPRDWETLILRALAKDPDDRFRTAGELEAAIVGLSVDPAAPGPRAPVGKDQTRLRPDGEATVRTLPSHVAARGLAIASQGERRRRPRSIVPTLSRRWLSLVLIVALMVAGVSTYLAAFRSPATARASVGDLVPGWGTISFLVPRLEQPQGIAVAPDGTVYLTDTKLDRVLHFSPSGRLLGSWGGKGRGFGQLRDPQAIAVDATGTVYVADTGNDRIQIFTEDGHFVRAWGRVGNGKREFRGPDGIAVDDQGDVIVSDYANNRVADFTSQGQWVHDVLNPLGPNGPISPGQLALDSAGRLYVANSYGDVLVANPSLDEQQNAPLAENGATSQGVAVDASGHLFVASAGLPSQVEEFSASGRLLRRWGPGGSTSAEFGSLGALALSPDGSSLYTVDTTRRRVELYSLRGQFQGGWGPAAGPTPPQQPDAVAVAPNGDVLVADTGNNRIVKMSRSGALLATWGSTGSRPGQFVLPRGLAVDMKGNTYVADQGNNRVQKLDPNGRVIAVWGARPLGSGVEPAALPSPRGVAIDPRGRILVLTGPSDAACCGGVIHVFTPAGRQVAVWPNLASGANSQPLGPSAIAIDRQGNVYVGDAFTGAVWVLDRHGVPVRQWPGSGLGQPSAVRGLTAGPGGNVYAVDTLHDRIDVFSPTGTLLASAGGTGSQSGQFMGPSGIAVDGQDNVYVADTGNDRVQKFAHVH